MSRAPLRALTLLVLVGSLAACGGSKDTELVPDGGSGMDARVRDGAPRDGATPPEDGAVPPPPGDGAVPPPPGDGAVPPPPGDGAVPPPPGDGAVPPDDGAVPPPGDGAVPPGDGGPIGDTQCTNGIDDDGDGLIDGFDPECTGPADNDEGTFATGIPGDNRDPFCQDCFFDGNSGSGDDRCRYATECLTGGTPTGGGGCATCDVSAECIDNCQRRAPNGCDCFGCCTVRLADGTNLDVLIGAGCSLETATDPTACPRCVPSTECGNPCGTCELCPGRTVDDLPPECFPPPPADAGPPPADAGPLPDGSTPPVDGSTPPADGSTPPPPPPPFTCDNGEQVCTATLPCPSGFYCLQGCCLPFF